MLPQESTAWCCSLEVANTTGLFPAMGTLLSPSSSITYSHFCGLVVMVHYCLLSAPQHKDTKFESSLPPSSSKLRNSRAIGIFNYFRQQCSSKNFQFQILVSTLGLYHAWYMCPGCLVPSKVA